MYFTISEEKGKSVRIFYVYIYTASSPKAECITRSIFWQSKFGLNSHFSFSYIDCQNKAKESSLPYYLPIAEEGGQMDSCLSQGKWNVNNLFWNSFSYDDNRYAFILINRGFIFKTKSLFSVLSRVFQAVFTGLLSNDSINDSGSIVAM